MKVVIGTKNKGKIEGAKKALEHYFQDVEIIGIPVESGVPEQPVNDDIYNGAKNRVNNLKKYCSENNIEAELYLAIESGIQNTIAGKWQITNMAVIENNNGFESYGTGPSFPVPEKLVNEIIETELNSVMTKLLEQDEQLHTRGGGIQLLTKDVISRIDIVKSAFVMALTEYINGDLWR